MTEIEELRARVEALEQETCAYSLLFRALSVTLGSEFIERAQRAGELIEADPQARGPLSQRMTEALRIIEDLRRISGSKPEPGKIV